jgi:hypothetical protein
MSLGKITLLITALVLMSSTAYSTAFELSKKTGEVEVEIRIDKNPPILGDNGIEIIVKGIDGKKITRAAVLVNYYMPPMPRMVPMNYVTPAGLKGDSYRTTLHLIMEGPWIIAIKISLAGKTSSAKFNITAR